jgi:glycerophosphoryl diester phosphodiesterase
MTIMKSRRTETTGRLPASPELDRGVFVRPIAHRGLHSLAHRCLENTAPAFRAAIDKGYGIECDLQAAEDGTPMVFHDEMLDRLVTASGPIAAYSPAALGKLRYRGLDEKILTFAQFLELVDARVPLLVEIKGNSAAAGPAFLEKIARLARSYRGPIALMSFDRRIVETLSQHAPKIPRGAIVGGHQMLATMWASRPRAERSGARKPEPTRVDVSFYAVDVKLTAVARRWLTRQTLQVPLFAWTIRTPRQRATAARWADAPIFEGYEP